MVIIFEFVSIFLVQRMILPFSFNSKNASSLNKVSSRYTAKSAFSISALLPTFLVSSLVKDLIGAPLRSGPKDGNAKA